jgi:hypothetical protein
MGCEPWTEINSHPVKFKLNFLQFYFYKIHHNTVQYLYSSSALSVVEFYIQGVKLETGPSHMAS